MRGIARHFEVRLAPVQRGLGGAKRLWRVRSRRSCGGRKVHGAVGGFRARGPFVQLQAVWRSRRLPLALSYLFISSERDFEAPI
jgi:hypothetical protein